MPLFRKNGKSLNKQIIFPKGIRFAKESEMPNSDNKSNLLLSIKNADIKEGYVLFNSDTDNYKYYSEINISAPKLWSLFEKLAIAILPESSAPILGHIDDANDELFYGSYTSTKKILEVCSNYKNELSNDGFIQFGIIHQVDGKTEEIFVKPTKHLVVWTNKLDEFKSVMNSFDIPEFEKMSFIDQFPITTLSKYEGQTKEHTQVLNELKTIL